MKAFSKWIILSVITLFFQIGTFGQSIQVVGSDFVGQALNLHDRDDEKVGDYSVEYGMSGSQIGLIKLRAGVADIAFVLRPEGMSEVEDLHAIPLGFWGVYFAVQEENPMTEVREQDVAEIMRKTRDGLKSEWGNLLVDEPKWTNRLIFVTFDIAESDPSYPVLLNQFYANEVPEKFMSMGERIEDPYLASSANLLVMARLPESNRGLRSLAWIEAEEEVGYTPSPESLFYGDYPLRSTLYLVVRDKKAPKVIAFLTSFFASDSMNLLKETGLVPVPENVQNQALLEFDLEF